MLFFILLLGNTALYILSDDNSLKGKTDLFFQRSRYDAEEEMRTAQKKRNGSSTPRSHTDVHQSHQFERNSARPQWRDLWRSYGSRGSEFTRSTRYS